MIQAWLTSKQKEDKRIPINPQLGKVHHSWVANRQTLISLMVKSFVL